MGSLLHRDDWPRLRAALPWLGLGLVALVALLPLFLERPLVQPVTSYASPILAWTSKAAVLSAMVAALGVGAWLARGDDPWAIGAAAIAVALALIMTAWHWFHLDRVDADAAWQRQMYFDILNHTREAPHQFRALPYGFARTLEHLTGDWTFACLAYRWFFTTCFVWGCYCFARLWLPAGLALVTLVPVLALYPLSVWYYQGQLTDPLSHALFVLAFLCTVRDRVALLAACLALGILAKETVMLMVPAYWACTWRGGLRSLLKTAALGVVCVAAFLAARVPFGWRLGGYEQINGTEALMIFRQSRYRRAALPRRGAPRHQLPAPRPVRAAVRAVPRLGLATNRRPAPGADPGADAALVAEQPVLRLDVRVAELHAALAATGDGGDVCYPISVTKPGPSRSTGN